MRKLKLDVESLAVVSFDTGEGETMRGTVEGNMITALTPVGTTSLLTPAATTIID